EEGSDLPLDAGCGLDDRVILQRPLRCRVGQFRLTTLTNEPSHAVAQPEPWSQGLPALPTPVDEWLAMPKADAMFRQQPMRTEIAVTTSGTIRANAGQADRNALHRSFSP